MGSQIADWRASEGQFCSWCSMHAMSWKLKSLLQQPRFASGHLLRDIHPLSPPYFLLSYQIKAYFLHYISFFSFFLIGEHKI